MTRHGPEEKLSSNSERAPFRSRKLDGKKAELAMRLSLDGNDNPWKPSHTITPLHCEIVFWVARDMRIVTDCRTLRKKSVRSWAVDQDKNLSYMGKKPLAGAAWLSNLDIQFEKQNRRNPTSVGAETVWNPSANNTYDRALANQREGHDAFSPEYDRCETKR